MTVASILSNYVTNAPFTTGLGKATPTPVVLWHGLASDSKDRRYITRDKASIETKISGIYVKSLQIPEQKFFITDSKQKILETLASITMPISRQVEVACRQIANDPRLQNGYNAIGYSQARLLFCTKKMD